MAMDRQVKRLWRALASRKSLGRAAGLANMDEKTARWGRRLESRWKIWSVGGGRQKGGEFRTFDGG